MGFRDLSTSRALLRAYDTPQSRWTRFSYRQQRQQQRQQQQLSILDTSKQIIKKSYCIHERVVFLVVRWLRSYGTPWSPQGESDQAEHRRRCSMYDILYSVGATVTLNLKMDEPQGRFDDDTITRHRPSDANVHVARSNGRECNFVDRNSEAERSVPSRDLPNESSSSSSSSSSSGGGGGGGGGGVNNVLVATNKTFVKFYFFEVETPGKRNNLRA
ncbi:hypothetical protein HZH66_005373 [Vespula vulgaris]|uniref:Uncharacterized protein n=1 Tax=Vespula vulgaris TaxID=7454 RepID=A0A834KCA7_VESVU|nr:hypothetical protein HZH66_005373 [Vespula vulgaris]